MDALGFRAMFPNMRYWIKDRYEEKSGS